ncbi:MAG: YecH family protein [Gammaproteobacteria bacterium]|nr:YecH family protein [Gammaproteobacteria bacterium]
MTEKIHGHEVMEMMLSSNRSYTKESLCAAILAKFGKDARFYTCAEENMTASDLVEFLESKGKFVETEAGFNTSPDKMCAH